MKHCEYEMILKNSTNVTISTITILFLLIFYPVLTYGIEPVKGESGPGLSTDLEDTTDLNREFVSIKGVQYEILPPWKGNRFGTKDDLQSMGLKMVPREWTFEQSKLYATLETRDAFVKMAEAAKQDGVLLQVDSGYRSMRYQKIIYKRLLEEGREFENIIKSVAPPGYSEHMLGTAFDFVPSSWMFVKTPARKWLEENAHIFCFEESYPENSIKKGFLWEPWHWRYNGCQRGGFIEKNEN